MASAAISKGVAIQHPLPIREGLLQFGRDCLSIRRLHTSQDLNHERLLECG
jgi:hypothetical protein